MPSLRRTSSTPAVRLSPYSNVSVATRGNGHRRSSGSDTTTRRVLAEIEWWRVTEGQCVPSSDPEMEDRNRGTQYSVTGFLGLGIPLTHVEAGVNHPVSLPRSTVDTADSNKVNYFYILRRASSCSHFAHRSPCSSHLSNSFLHWPSRLTRRHAGTIPSSLPLLLWSRLPRQRILRSTSTLTKLS